MRNIHKTEGLECLREVPNETAWGEFSSDCKQEVAEKCFDEQNGLCVYCERALQFPNWTDSAHIEHIKPQGNTRYPQFRFCYDNLTLSCNGKPSDPMNRASYGDNEFSSCGPSKGGYYDENLFISPVAEEEISTMITWNKSSASMEPKQGYEERVNYMICILNINNFYLTNARKKALGELVKTVLANPASKDLFVAKIKNGKTEFCSFLNSILSSVSNA